MLTKQIFQNNERKFYQQVGGECTRTDQEPNAKKKKKKKSKQFRTSEWMNNMNKELQAFEENPEVIIYLELLRATHKNCFGNRQAMMTHTKSG